MLKTTKHCRETKGHLNKLRAIPRLLIGQFNIIKMSILPKQICIQMVPTQDFLTLQWCESNTHLIETVLQNLNFDLFPGQCYVVTILSRHSGQWQLQLPVSPAIRRVNNRYTYHHSVPRHHSGFLLSVQYSINYMRYSTLYYKIRFVSDDFAQLQANVSVLSTCMVGQATL